MKKTPPNQRPHRTQIIWVCPDIWVFSVLHNRHLSDIWVICQKCQFGVRKAWKALFLQLKPQDMHCKQADSDIENLLFGFYPNTSDLKQICIFVAKRCEMSKIRAFRYLSDLKRIRTFVAKRRKMSKIHAFCHHFWLRFYSDIWSKKWWVEPLICSAFLHCAFSNASSNCLPEKITLAAFDFFPLCGWFTPSPPHLVKKIAYL